MNIIFEKEEVPNNFRKTLIKPLYKKGTEERQWETTKSNGEKIILDLNYTDDLSILDEGVSKMNELLEVLRVQGARIGLN